MNRYSGETVSEFQAIPTRLHRGSRLRTKRLYYVPSFADLPVALLLARGIKGIGLDVDQSVTGHHDNFIKDENLRKIEELAAASIAMTFISNANGERVPRVQFLSKYVLEKTGVIIPPITSGEHANGLLKPLPPIMLTASERLGIAPEYMAHFGDQVSKDGLGAVFAGYAMGVICEPYGGASGNPAVDVFQRRLEAPVVDYLREHKNLVAIADAHGLNGDLAPLPLAA